MNQRVIDYVQRTGNTDPETIRIGIKKKGSVPMAEIRATLAELGCKDTKPQPSNEPSTKTALCGINLVNVRVFDRKPNDGLKAKIYGLKKGKGYQVEDLAEEWRVSSETLRNHAKRLDSLKYVEVAPGDWVQCVLHPETATALSS
jgi:hypothetical protein